MVFPNCLSTEQADDYIRETFKWHLRGARHPFCPLPDNYFYLCPYFDLDMAKESTRDFCIAEMTYVVFYAMVVNDAFELGVVNRELAKHLKSSLECIWWYMCEAW